MHTVVVASGSVLPSSVWVLELSDVEWRGSDGWSTAIAEVLADSDGEPQMHEDVAQDGGRVLDIVARTSHIGAPLIMDQKRLSTLLVELSGKTGLPSSSGESISAEMAESAVLAALQTHFSTTPEEVGSMDSKFEPDGEYLIQISAGKRRYIATFRRRGAIHQLHLVDRTELG